MVTKQPAGELTDQTEDEQDIESTAVGVGETDAEGSSQTPEEARAHRC